MPEKLRKNWPSSWGVRQRAVEGGAKLTEAMIFMPPPVFWATQKKMLTLAPRGVAGDVLG